MDKSYHQFLTTLTNEAWQEILPIALRENLENVLEHPDAQEIIYRVIKESLNINTAIETIRRFRQEDHNIDPAIYQTILEIEENTPQKILKNLAHICLEYELKARISKLLP